MKCLNCKEEIIAKDPDLCPYCGSYDIVDSSDTEVADDSPDPEILERIDKLERAERFEDAALLYEELEMWDKAGETRRKARTNYVISANLKIAGLSSISVNCPNCGASQPVESKSNEVTCSYCKKKYIIPKKILELL
jgi:uncharacterized Zn-finger protein